VKEDWSVDIFGHIPVRCLFFRTFGIEGLAVNVSVIQSDKLTITGHQLHAGPIGDKLDKIVEAKIAGMVDTIPQINTTETIYSRKDAQDGYVTVLKTGLVLELVFISR
jgi:hypothetical protein